MKLSTRLQAVYDCIPLDYYDHIYDLCCDHGKLGLKFYQEHQKTIVYCIDRVEVIIENLQHYLLTQAYDKNRITAIQLDATKFKLTNVNSLVLICGVGGLLAIKIIKNLLSTSNGLPINLGLIAHKNIHELREFLITEGFNLISEKLVLCQGKFYEVLYVSNKIQGEKIGETLNFANLDQSKETKEYLNFWINFFSLKCEFNRDLFHKHMLSLYQEQIVRLNTKS